MISYIKIENFRSIKYLEMWPENLCALIGPNSVGKTNILKAIDLVLGEGWTTKAKVAKELFNDSSLPINIEIQFSRPIKYRTGYGEVEADGVKLLMKLNPLECSVTTTPDGKYLSDDFKKKCHFIYIPSSRDLSDQMRVSNWTLLGKMMKEIHQNYVESYGGNEDKLKDDLKTKIKPAKDFIEKDFDPNKTTFDKFVQVFKKYCDLNSIGLASKFVPELNIYNLNWFYKTLQIQVFENDGHLFDAEELGSGMQNLILISIFQTYSELMGGRVIFGIEEPEIYLYPQAQRALYESFQDLSSKTQIIYTTHNPNFVNAERANEIEIIQKSSESGTFSHLKNGLISSEYLEKCKHQIYTHFNPYRNELFFAKKIILVEGPSDKILWESLCKCAWNLDINKLGISIIDCTGKGGVIYFTGVCRLLNLNYFSIWDSDGETPHDLLKLSIDEDMGLEISPNLEEFLSKKYHPLKFSNVDNLKVKQAYEWASSTKNWPEEFNIVHKFIHTPDRVTISPPTNTNIPDDEGVFEKIPF